MLLDLEDFTSTIWEPACGEGHISKVLQEHGYEVISTDLIDRGFGQGNTDFLAATPKKNVDIITNPPYKFAKEFCEKALDCVDNGRKVAMFLKLTFLEGKNRREFFEKHPPKTVYVSSSRLNCARNGDFEKTQSAVCYAWFIWEKGYVNAPEIRWFN